MAPCLQGKIISKGCPAPSLGIPAGQDEKLRYVPDVNPPLQAHPPSVGGLILLLAICQLSWRGRDGGRQRGQGQAAPTSRHSVASRSSWHSSLHSCCREFLSCASLWGWDGIRGCCVKTQFFELLLHEKKHRTNG